MKKKTAADAAVFFCNSELLRLQRDECSQRVAHAVLA
jgi:hypothetical protein